MDFIRRWYKGSFANANGEDVLVKDISLTLSAATNNQQVIAAVSGKEIRVLSGNIISAGLESSIVFKSASGGTAKQGYIVPPTSSDTPNVTLEPNEFGWMRTTAGDGLFADVGAVALRVSLNYIEV